MPLDPDLTLAYMHGFLGYGNPKAKWWFVGAEEGGGNSVEEVEARIAQWHTRGKRQIEDLRDFSTSVRHGLDRWFCKCGKNGPPIQTTWGKLIRVKMTALGQIQSESHTDRIRNYQTEHWGKDAGCTFLTEVLPLPASGDKHWPYICRNWWKDEGPPTWANERATSWGECSDARTKHIRDILGTAGGLDNDRVVVVYAGKKRVDKSLRAKDWVREILGGESCNQIEDDHDPETRIRGKTLFYFAMHAAARAPKGYWTNVGKRIAEVATSKGINLA